MDLRQVKNLMKEFEDSKIHKLEITEDGFTIKLEKEDTKVFSSAPIVELAQQPVGQVQQAAPTNNVEEKLIEYTEVKAPLVGTFYQSPSPDSDPFVGKGSKVKKGDTLFIVEAMKVMNEITAPCSGEVVNILINDGSMVEFGQVIMEIKE